jgi:hypothetical protein
MYFGFRSKSKFEFWLCVFITVDLGVVLIRVSIAVIKQQDQNHPGEEGVIIFHLGNLRRELQTRTWRQAPMVFPHDLLTPHSTQIHQPQ